MNHVLSIGEFFVQEDPKLTAIRESLLELQSLPSKFVNLIYPINETVSNDNVDRNIAHQLYLLDNYEHLSHININENLLLLKKYDPVLLTEFGIYEKTLTELIAVNENVLSTLKSAWNAMTEDSSPIGVFHFILDLIGLVPASWLGFPVDIVANGLNALIYFIRENYLMGVINLIACFDLAKIFAPLKIGIKAVAKPASLLFGSLFKHGGGRAGALLFKGSAEATSNPTIVKSIGRMLASMSKWLQKTGLNMLKGLVPTLAKAVDKLTFGAFKLNAAVPKMTAALDQSIAKLNIFTKEADEASKILLSAATAKAGKKTLTKSVDKVGNAAVATANRTAISKTGKALNPGAQAAVRVAASNKVLSSLGKLDDLTVNAIKKSSAKFDTMFPAVKNATLKDNFIINDASKQLVENIMSKKVGLLSITGNKKVMQTLASGKTWKGADKMLANAIKKGNPEELGKVMKKMLDDPEFFKLISKTSPDITKTMSLFKNAPEALINGSKTFVNFAGTAGTKWYKLMQSLPIFMLKAALKGTECGRYIQKADSADDVTELTKQAVQTKLSPQMSQVAEILARVYEQEDNAMDLAEIQKAKAALKASDPAAFQQYQTAESEANSAIEKFKQQTDSINPCADVITAKQGVVGAAININNQAYQENYRGSIDLKTPEDFKKSNLNNYSKGVLDAIGQDSNIDAQHPISKENPVIKAYFSPIVNYSGEISNEPKLERLDASLDEMLKAGEITEEQKIRIRERVINSWQTDTIPPEVINVEQPSTDTNESIFKIGKLITTK